MMGVLAKFWSSPGASNIMLVALAIVLINVWISSSRKVDVAEEYAAATKLVLSSNNEAAIEGIERIKRDIRELERYETELQSNQEAREFLDMPIPESVRHGL